MANSNYHEERRPLHDKAEPLRRPGFKAGGGQGKLASRKNESLHTGSIGFVPGHDEGTGPRSSSQAGFVHENMPSGPEPGTTDLEYARRPMPRHQPMEEEYLRTGGRRVRYLDGRNRLMRDRPALLAEMHDPDTHPDDKADLRQHIAERDAYHNHVYW